MHMGADLSPLKYERTVADGRPRLNTFALVAHGKSGCPTYSRKKVQVLSGAPNTQVSPNVEGLRKCVTRVILIG